MKAVTHFFQETTKLFSSNNPLLLFMAFIKYRYVCPSSADQNMQKYSRLLTKMNSKPEAAALTITNRRHTLGCARRLAKQARVTSLYQGLFTE